MVLLSTKVLVFIGIVFIIVSITTAENFYINRYRDTNKDTLVHMFKIFSFKTVSFSVFISLV